MTFHKPPQRGPPGGLTPEQYAEYLRQLMGYSQTAGLPTHRVQMPWDPVTSVQSQEEISLGRTRRRVDPVPNPRLRREGESRVDHYHRQKGYEEAQRLGQPTPLGYGQPEPQTIEELTQAFAGAPRPLDMYGQERNVPAEFDVPGHQFRGAGEAVMATTGEWGARLTRTAGRILPGAPGEGFFGPVSGPLVEAGDRLREHERGRMEASEGRFVSALGVPLDKPNAPGILPHQWGMQTMQNIARFGLEAGPYLAAGGPIKGVAAKGAAAFGGTRLGAAITAVWAARAAPKVAAATAGAASIAPRTTAAVSGAARFLKAPAGDVAAFLPIDILTTQYKEDSTAAVVEMFLDPEIRAQWEEDPEGFYSRWINDEADDGAVVRARKAATRVGMNALHVMAEKAMESEIGRAAFEAAFGFSGDIALRGGFGALVRTPALARGGVRAGRKAGQWLADPAGVGRSLEGLELDLTDPFGVGDRFPEIAPRTEVLPTEGRLEGPEVAPRTVDGLPLVEPGVPRDPESGLRLDPESGVPLLGTGERLPIEITPRIREAAEGGTRLEIPPRLLGPAALAKGGSLTGRLGTGIPTPEVPSRQAPSRYIRIPDEKVATNLRLAVKNREKSAATGKPMPGNPNNPRTVIRAAPGSGNPDVVVGDITQDDWIQRTESVLNPEEIAASARWYQEVFPQFERAAGGDPEEIKKLVAAWLSANQNQSPENALKQVLRVREHVLRGVPAEDLPAAGLPGVTRAVHDILTGKQATAVGPKISDFFDSAEGRSVRTWMGLDAEGGAPFVVDIHTARDTGLVDERLVSILKRRGYDSEALDALKIEKPAGAKYENRAEFGRALTGHLNSIDWMGRSDWKPSEIQAVGWAAMRKITAEADVQAIPDVIEESTRRIAFEVLPGEHSAWDKKFSGRLGVLPSKELAAVTRKVGAEALRLAASETGVKDLAAVVHSIGGWEDAVTPNITGRFLASGEAMDAMTARLGYYLDQTEVLGSTLRPEIKKPKAYAVDFLEVGTSALRNDADLEKFWKVIQDADDTGTFKGFMPVEYADGSAGVRVIFDLDYVSEGIGGVGAPKLRASLEPGGAINKALEGLDLGVDVEVRTRLFQTELSRSVNDFKGVPDGASHLRRLTDITGRGPTDADLLNRQELTRSLEEALGAAEGRAGGPRVGDPRAGGARAGVDRSTTLGLGLGGASEAMLRGAARPAGKALAGGLVGGLADASVGEDDPIGGALLGAGLALSPSAYRALKGFKKTFEVPDEVVDRVLADVLATEAPATEALAGGAPEGVAATTAAGPRPEGIPSTIPPRTPDADKIDPNDYVNIKKFGLQPGSTEERLERGVQEIVIQYGINERQVLTHKQTIRIAASLGLDPQDIAKQLGNKEGAAFLQARTMIADNTIGLEGLYRQLDDNGIHIDSEEAAPIVAQINALAGENNYLTAKYLPAQTSAARTMNAFKIAAQHSMDPATWLLRAARMSGVSELPPGVQADILRLTRVKDKPGLMKLLANLQKSNIAEQVVALGKAAMLSAVPTHVMNLLSTAYNVFAIEHLKDLPAGMVYDPILSAWAGTERTKHWGSVAAQWEAGLKGGWQGLEGARNVARGMMPEGSMERWDQPRQVNIDLFERIFGEVSEKLAEQTPLLRHVPAIPKIIDRALDIGQKTVFGALGAGDALLTGFAVQRSLAEQARVRALNEGLKGAAMYDRAKVILQEEMSPFELLASLEAGLKATFRNKGILGQMVASAKRTTRQTAFKVGARVGAGDPAHTAVYLGTEGIVPWSMTPSNVVTTVAEGSPLGAVSVAAEPYFWKLVMRRVDVEMPEVQKRIVERLGRSTVGGAPLLLGMYLYSKGVLSLHYDLSKAGQRELTGEEENSWKIGDDWISMERMSPGSNLVILGGHIMDEWQKARKHEESGLLVDVGRTALVGTLSIGRTVYEQSFLEGVRRSGEWAHSTERESGREGLGVGQVSMFVPNLLKRLNRWADPTMRVRETIGDELRQFIPGASYGLPARIDAFGQPRKYREGFYGSMIDPLQMSRDKTLGSPTRKLIADLDVRIGRRQQLDDETAEEFEVRLRAEGQTLEAAIATYMVSPEFRGIEQRGARALPPNADARMVDSVNEAVREQQRDLITKLITNERTRYSQEYREYRNSQRLTGAAR